MKFKRENIPDIPVEEYEAQQALKKQKKKKKSKDFILDAPLAPIEQVEEEHGDYKQRHINLGAIIFAILALISIFTGNEFK